MSFRRNNKLQKLKPLVTGKKQRFQTMLFLWKYFIKQSSPIMFRHKKLRFVRGKRLFCKKLWFKIKNIDKIDENSEDTTEEKFIFVCLDSKSEF